MGFVSEYIASLVGSSHIATEAAAVRELHRHLGQADSNSNITADQWKRLLD